MDVYRDLGLEPIINASGSVTRLGGAPMPPEVVEAYAAAAREWVPLEDLQAAASTRIAAATGAEAGLVTSGSAAALTLGAAAILTGNDLGRMERLPHADGFPHRLLMARDQRSGYDHAVRASGARIVEVGFNEQVAGAGVRRTEVWEYEAAFDESIAGVFYVFTPDSEPPLPEVIEWARGRKIPVLVDAAGELPPRGNLRRFIEMGADLVGFSGGKAIRGPQATGILCGRRDLVGSAALQMLDMDDYFDLWDPPRELFDKQQLGGIPRHGIGRGMKVAKEQIVALLKALELFASGAYDKHDAEYARLFEIIAADLAGSPVECDVPGGAAIPQMVIRLRAEAPVNAHELCRRLRKGSPPIYPGQGHLHENALSVNPTCVDEDQARTLARRIVEELA